jgi:WD40 repeat protein
VLHISGYHFAICWISSQQSPENPVIVGVTLRIVKWSHAKCAWSLRGSPLQLQTSTVTPVSVQPLDDGAVALAFHCKLHKGWIADLQFLEVPTTTSHVAAGAQCPWLATASNDGALSIWNTANMQPSGAFAHLATTTSLHRGGIYSMHARQCASSIHFLTASKDAAVKQSSLQGDGAISVIREWADLHANVAKTVRWRSHHEAASGGNDRRAPKEDLRLALLQWPGCPVCFCASRSGALAAIS